MSTAPIVGGLGSAAEAKKIIPPVNRSADASARRPRQHRVILIGLAVIGLGAIGRLHARNLAREVTGARVAVVADTVAELAEGVAAELGTRSVTRPADALADPEVSAAVIAVPSPLHAELVEAAAAAGVHVFCEKPLGLEPAAAERALAATRAAGVVLQVGFQRRFDPDFLAARERIEAGALGAIQLLRIAHRNRTPPHPGELRERLGSIFVDMTVHDFDMARWLVGEVEEVHAFERTRNALTVIRFRSGALGVIDNSRHAGYGFECSAELVGSESSLRIGTRGRPFDLDVLTSAGTIGHVAEDHVERHLLAYREELRHFVACVRDGEEPRVGGDDAVAALQLARAAERCVA